MTVKVYIDVLFIINFIIDYILLCVTSFFVKRKVSVLKLCIASATGGTYAVFAFFLRMNPAVTFVFSLLSSIVMISICYGIRNPLHVMKNTSVFYLVTLCTAGLSLAFISASEYNFLTGTGFIYTNINAYTLLFVFVLSLFIIHISAGFIKKQHIKSNYLYPVTIEKNGKSITNTALFDSGNFLREPLSQKNVIIAEWAVVSKLFEKNNLYECIADNPGDFFYVPCKILGGATEIFAFSPEKVFIGKEEISESVLIGVSEKSLDCDEVFKIILPNGICSAERM